MQINYKLDKKYKDILEKFIIKYKKDNNVIGILVSGSIVYGLTDKNSDLDVHIILKKSKTRTRGNTWIDGVEIEYFINPIKQIKHYIESEIDSKAPCTAHMFTNSIIVYKKGKDLDKLLKLSKIALSKEIKPLEKKDIELIKYQLDDLKKDFEDVYLKKDLFTFNIIYIKIIIFSLETFYKIKRVAPEKLKRSKDYIKNIDKNFYKIYDHTLTETNIKKKYNLVLSLINYLEILIGGKRANEWIFESNCDYN